MHVSWQPYRHPTIETMLKGFEAVGVPFNLDINGETQLGHTVVQNNAMNGERWSTYRSFLQPALDRKNLVVKTFATARRVLFEGAEFRAAGVEYPDAAGQVGSHSAQTVSQICDQGT